MLIWQTSNSSATRPHERGCALLTSRRQSDLTAFPSAAAFSTHQSCVLLLPMKSPSAMRRLPMWLPLT